MLKLFYDLEPFFKDNYIRIHVRGYAKIINITPPTASKKLENYVSETLLKKEQDKQYNYYFANKESPLFKDLQKIYWNLQLQPVIKYIETQLFDPTIILFGSATKAELQEKSDLDIAIITKTKKELKLTNFEKKLRKSIQLFTFSKLGEIPEGLKNNILNGYLIGGNW